LIAADLAVEPAEIQGIGLHGREDVTDDVIPVSYFSLLLKSFR
jgi:hypothetical protein